CIVPYVRGPLRNRNYKDILREIEEAVNSGINSITLLGQNVNAYEYNDVNFIKLIKIINTVKGLKHFSFITSHPKDVNLDLFKTMQDLDKLKKYLHLPVQSGSNRILELMKRGYSRQFYLDLVDNYRKIVKDGKLTTDIMVGFPTETEADFEDTVDLVKKVRFDSAYIFKYSVRPHTEASFLKDDVSKEEKEKRHSILLKLQKTISKTKDLEYRIGF
ncbi:MAG: radical SAM protein, partial [Candidatus Omnitrophica bacterium]|nr:radical SAM protein [Candidatus Omnitrophota bacterium]